MAKTNFTTQKLTTLKEIEDKEFLIGVLENGDQYMFRIKSCKFYDGLALLEIQDIDMGITDLISDEEIELSEHGEHFWITDSSSEDLEGGISLYYIKEMEEEDIDTIVNPFLGDVIMDLEF